MIVAIEGLPGAGKTTLVKHLSHKCRGSLVISELVIWPKDKNIDEDFFVKNDYEKFRIIENQDVDKTLILLDRSYLSTLVYNLALSNIPRKINSIKTFQCYLLKQSIFYPDLIVFLNINERISLQRSSYSHSDKIYFDNWEKEDFLKLIIKHYAYYLKHIDRIVETKTVKTIKIDADKMEPSLVARRVFNVIARITII